jgi:polyhydroxybutyrate depolymerase
MKYKIILVSLLVSSCGGGSSGNNLNNDETLSPTTPLPLSENCVDIGSNVQRCSFVHDGLDRYYLIQDSHPEAEGLSSIIFNLHGFGSNALEQMQYTSLNTYTYTKEKNFILIHPQGAPLETFLTSSASHWNSGGWTIGSTVDDVDFIDTIIELVSNKHDINMNRIYSTGMSNGGFMSYHLACNLSSKIAAVASVTGSMSEQTFESCNPQHSTSVLQIHGTLDTTVPFNGNPSLGMEPLKKVVTFWQEYNSCNVEPLISSTDFFDLGYSIEHSQYTNCINNQQVELYKVEGMRHVWPAADRFGISASDIIWEFFNTYDINGEIN